LTDEELASLVPVLSGFRGLHELVLSGNAIGPRGMAALAGSLQGMRELKILDLAGNSLQGGGIMSLARALEKLPQLKELHLQRTQLAAADIGPLAAALQGLLRLRTLGLSFNRLGGCSAADWAALLGATGLESLRLSNCSLESPDVARLAAGLKDCPTLKTLSLAGYDATATEVAQALAEGLACLPQLETCHLPVLGEDPLRVLLPTLRHLQGCSLKKVTLCPNDRDLAGRLQLALPRLKVDS
jgi:Ran GTPase-activating protein (RanGAP) involved in mRNA processing and transport